MGARLAVFLTLMIAAPLVSANPYPGLVAPPTDLRADVTDDGILLEWNPPLLDMGGPIQGYAVYRWVDAPTPGQGIVAGPQHHGGLHLEPFAVVPGDQTWFVDQTTSSSMHTYGYVVTTLGDDGESLPSLPAIIHFGPAGCDVLVLYMDPEQISQTHAALYAHCLL